MSTRHERVRGSVFLACVLALAGVVLPLFAQEPPREAGPAATTTASVAQPSDTGARPPIGTAAPATSEGATRAKPPVMAWLNAGLGVPPAIVRRDNPRETVAGFLEAGRAQEWMLAAHYLNLTKVAVTEQRRQGPELARQLFDVLENQVWFDLDSISEDPAGALDKTPATKDFQVASIPLRSGTQGIRLSRVTDGQGRQVWVVSTATVDAIKDLYGRYGPPELLLGLPSWARSHEFLTLEPWQWAGLVALVAMSLLFAFALEKSTIATARSWNRRKGKELDPELTRLLEGPGGMAAGLLLMIVLLPWLRLVAAAEQVVGRIVMILVIVVATRVVVRLVHYGAAVIEAHSKEHVAEDSKRREIATRVATMRRIAAALVWLVGIGLALMQFPAVRNVGWSLLGSAGIAGAVIGFAAQKTFANVFAGIVISLTQPIRMGDTVIVEKEYGEIEEIGSTHVVVKLWDLRRLVLPIVYFLDSPFENWTRTGAELVGVVRLQADYRVNVADVRQELTRVLEGEELWNGKTAALIVEDMGTEAVTLRITVSADNSGRLWDLRCKVREKMLAFLQQEPNRLPIRRVESLTITKASG